MNEKRSLSERRTASGKHIGRPSRILSFKGATSRDRTEGEAPLKEIRFDDVIALAENGVTLYDTARRLDISYSTLRDVLGRFGQIGNLEDIRKRYRIDGTILGTMAADGMTVRDVAEHFGCSPKTVREIAGRHGLTDAFGRNSDRRSQQRKRSKEEIIRRQYIDIAMERTGDTE